MNVDVDTIQLYIKEASTKIEILKSDIVTYQYRIKQTEKEISTLEYLIKQYEKTLTMVTEEDCHAQKNHGKSS